VDADLFLVKRLPRYNDKIVDQEARWTSRRMIGDSAILDDQQKEVNELQAIKVCRRGKATTATTRKSTRVLLGDKCASWYTKHTYDESTALKGP
jgi:hypothetical protein